MVRQNFVMDNFIINELSSGLQLQMMENDTQIEDVAWLTGWFTLPNGNLVIQQFQVVEAGIQTYEVASQALVFWGETVLDAKLYSVEMSPEFSKLYLFSAIVQYHQSRLN